MAAQSPFSSDWRLIEDPAEDGEDLNKYFAVEAGMGAYPLGFRVTGFISREDATLMANARRLYDVVAELLSANREGLESLSGEQIGQDIAAKWFLDAEARATRLLAEIEGRSLGDTNAGEAA